MIKSEHLPTMFREVDLRVVELARLLSPAMSVEPALLRDVRLTLRPDLDASIEGHLIRSQLVESKGISGFVLKPKIATWLREDLIDDSDLFEQCVDLIDKHHQSWSPELRIEEKVIAASLRKDYDLVDRELEVLAGLSNYDGVQQWAAQALPRLPDSVGHSQAARRLGVAALKSPVPGAKISWMPRISEEHNELAHAYRELEETELRVRYFGSMVHFGNVSGPGTVRIPMPKTDPLQFELEWRDGSRNQRETILMRADETVRRSVGTDLVMIKTLRGEVFEIHPWIEEDQRVPPDGRFEYDLAVIASPDDAERLIGMVGELRSAGLRVWSVHDSLSPESHWVDAIQEPISRSKVLLCALSEKGAFSGIMRVANEYFQSSGGEGLFVAMLEPCDLPKWLQNAEVLGGGEVLPDQLVGEIIDRLNDGSEREEEPHMILAGHSAPVLTVALSADGDRLVSGSDDGEVRVWESGKGECVSAYRIHQGAVLDVRYIGEGRKFVTGGEDGKIFSFEDESSSPVPVEKFAGPVRVIGNLPNLGESPNTPCAAGDAVMRASMFETSDADDSNRVMKSFDGDNVLDLVRVSKGRWVAVLASGKVVFSDSSEVAYHGPPGVAFISLMTNRSQGLSKAPSPIGEILFVGTSVGEVRVIRPGSQQQRVLIGHLGPVSCLMVDRWNSETLLSGSWDGTVRLWNVDSGVCLKVWRFESAVNSLAIFDDGEMMAVGCDDTRVYLYRISSREMWSGQHSSWSQVARVTVHHLDESLLAESLFDETVVDFQNERFTRVRESRGPVMDLADFVESIPKSDLAVLVVSIDEVPDVDALLRRLESLEPGRSEMSRSFFWLVVVGRDVFSDENAQRFRDSLTKEGLGQVHFHPESEWRPTRSSLEELKMKWENVDLVNIPPVLAERNEKEETFAL